MKCSKCSNEIETYSQYCPYCGDKIEEHNTSNYSIVTSTYEEEYAKISFKYSQRIITQEEYLRKKSELQRKYGINSHPDYKKNSLDRRGPFAKTPKPWLFWSIALIILVFFNSPTSR